jgi:hypothetical protein
MRIVGLDEFLALPNETLFCKYYGEMNWGDLRIRGGLAYKKDFMFQNLLEVDANDTGERLELETAAKLQGAQMKLDLDCPGRDGMYNERAYFVVFEKEDVEGIIARLQPVLKAFGG